jgi:hypothetical protein
MNATAKDGVNCTIGKLTDFGKILDGAISGQDYFLELFFRSHIFVSPFQFFQFNYTIKNSEIQGFVLNLQIEQKRLCLFVEYCQNLKFQEIYVEILKIQVIIIVKDLKIQTLNKTNLNLQKGE